MTHPAPPRSSLLARFAGPAWEPAWSHGGVAVGDSGSAPWRLPPLLRKRALVVAPSGDPVLHFLGVEPCPRPWGPRAGVSVLQQIARSAFA